MKKFLSLLLALALCAGLSAPACAAGFSDVPAGHYAASAIDSCVAKGIASGYSDGTFKPGNLVTRAQFCVMLVRAFYPELYKAYDTPEARAQGWFVPAVETLYNRDPEMDPLVGTSFEGSHLNASVMSQPISRYDMAQVMSGVITDYAQWLDIRVSDSQRTSIDGKIGDWSRVPQQYQHAVSECYSLGILTGQSDGTFGGNNTMNRAQGCVVIDRLSKVLAGETVAQPAAPAQPATAPAASGVTLTNGQPATEENVYALLMQLKEQYPLNSVLYTSYAEGDNSPVKKITSNYLTYDSKTISVTRGYGAVSAFFSDKIFGTNVTYRKVDLSQVKPGDIALFPCDEGKVQQSMTILGRITPETKLEVTPDQDQIGGIFCVMGAEVNGQTRITTWCYPCGPIPSIDYWSCY